MTPKNKLEAILFALPHMGKIEHDLIAIIAAVQWIAERECPDGFGTYWHKKCQGLVNEEPAR